MDASNVKIKIFRGEPIDALEKAANKFMNGRCVIDVKYQAIYVPTKFTGPAISESTVHDSIMIIYRETELELKPPSSNHCVFCGKEIPEGRMTCPTCECAFP
jgi:hypothetical protein